MVSARQAGRRGGWRFAIAALAAGTGLGIAGGGVAGPAYAAGLTPTAGGAAGSGGVSAPARSAQLRSTDAASARQPARVRPAGLHLRGAHRSATGAPVDHPRAMTWTWSGPITSPQASADPSLQYVQVANGTAIAQAFYAFRLPAGLTAAQLNQASLAIPVDTSEAAGYVASSAEEVPTLEACPVSTPWTAARVPPGSPQSGGPTFSCTAVTASQGALGTVGSQTVATFDVTALVGAWLSGTRNDGLAITANSGAASLPLAGAQAVLDVTTFASTGAGVQASGVGAGPLPTSSTPAAPPAAAGSTSYTPVSPLTPLGLSGTPASTPAASAPVLAGPPVSPSRTTARPRAQAVGAVPASDQSGGVPVILWLLLGVLAAALARAGRLLGAARGAPLGDAGLELGRSGNARTRGVGVPWTFG